MLAARLDAECTRLRVSRAAGEAQCAHAPCRETMCARQRRVELRNGTVKFEFVAAEVTSRAWTQLRCVGLVSGSRWILLERRNRCGDDAGETISSAPPHSAAAG